jgi:hypothetical protein
MDIAAYREKLRQRAAENRLSFQGEYREQIEGLLGLSREEIDRMTPGTADLETYDHLITVIKTASETNLSQAQLREEIKRLGEIGVQIAGKVPALAKLLV